MNFFLDENVDAPVAHRLREEGHAVVCAWELSPGLTDEQMLGRANRDSAILVTADKDFGELVFRLGRIHSGVLLLRLAGLPPARKAQIVSSVVRDMGREMTGAFTVVTPDIVRLRKRSAPHTGASD